ncbi:hypothetical protein E2C01_064681 [Portunus trituberculatus]|uniref:Uncharacterized protein n=1 Tax=Portunus trituberculatus TaxID=210409 RepID=A0A5B7HGS4_PORTR|nr:hypothetical protein [Portunus trituberculatus]
MIDTWEHDSSSPWPRKTVVVRAVGMGGGGFDVSAAGPRPLFPRSHRKGEGRLEVSPSPANHGHNTSTPRDPRPH